MKKEELKEIIGKLLNSGESLSEIQNILASEYKENITFLELRLIASEIEDIDWTKDEESDEKPEEDANESEKNPSLGKTVVEVSRLQRPGVALSGSVKFASGASADWILDQMGRLGFEKSDGEPTEEDLQEFQLELKKQLGQ